MFPPAGGYQNCKPGESDNMQFRKATLGDIDSMERLIMQAKASLKRAGVDQWQGVYPDRSTCEQDVSKGEAYVLELDGAVAGMATLSFEKEAGYEHIEGAGWRGGGLYAVIHRMAVGDGVKRMGLASRMIGEIEKICAARGVYIIRTDTHKYNKPMNAALVKNGFVYRGIIHMEYDNSERAAFDKALE